MPIWSEILAELNASRQGTDRPPDFDGIRRGYLARLHGHTGRNAILYASAWLQKPDALAPGVSIHDEDIQALMEVTHGMAGHQLDLILHSPGGSPEAAEGIVSYLRSRFRDIRVIVPHLAMSAATMIACAANAVILGKHSFLGPIDPQLALPTPLGPRFVSAHATLAQFRRAQEESVDPTKLAAWLPMLGQYGPDLLVRCETVLRLSRELVARWLDTYMLAGDDQGQQTAESIAQWLADHDTLKSHARHIPRSELKTCGMVVSHLEDDEQLQDLSLSVFHATTHTFSGTPVVKIVENHEGRAFVKHHIVRPAPPPDPPATK